MWSLVEHARRDLSHLVDETSGVISRQCLFVGYLVAFYVPSTARSFRDGAPINCPFRRTWSSVNTPGRRVAVHYATAAPRKLHVPVCIRDGGTTYCTGHGTSTQHNIQKQGRSFVLVSIDVERHTRSHILVSWVWPDQ